METKDKKRGVRQKTSNRPQPQKRRREEVVYTQPAPFRKDRFILQLLTVVAVVLALVFGLSIFFKVNKAETRVTIKNAAGQVLVEGENKYTAADIVAASGIKDGENLLTLRESEIAGRILEKLPYITQVRVRISLPDTVNIEVVETDVIYAAEAFDGSWWFIRSDGKILEKTNAADAAQKTLLIGVKLETPSVGKQAKAYQPEQTETTETETETEEPLILASEQLEIALEIFDNLEKNGVIGKIVSVDVTNVNRINMWYQDRFSVDLGDSNRLDYKISAMKAAIDKLQSYQRGELDVSFTTLEKEVRFKSFE